MKNTKRVLIGAMAGIMLAAGGSTAAAQESGGTDLEELFYTYSQDNMVFDYTNEDYIYADYRLGRNGYQGFLSLYQMDYNWDGEEELLAVRVRNQTNEEGRSTNVLLGEIYQYQGDRLQRIAQCTLAENVLAANSIHTDVFLVSTDIGMVLCCESKETTSLLADGTAWSFRSFSYDGAEFQTYAQAAMNGSSFEEADVDEGWSALSALGLYPAEIVYQPISEQVSNLTLLNTIQRETTASYEEVSALLNGSEGDSLAYGTTYFGSFVNTGRENKINKQFVTALDTQEIPAAESSDFIIPDSDSRYITQEELDNLTEYEIFIARNEIYARHGRIFNNEELNEYFLNRSWYEPTVAGSEFTNEYAASVFTEYEIKNISTMVNYEKAHGMNGY